MRALIVLLAFAACSNKPDSTATPGSTGSGSAPAPAPAPAPAKPAVAIDAAAVAAAPVVCCCESTGDATHYTIEGDPSACTAEDMGGSCVELKECSLDAPPQVLSVGTPVTVEAAGLVAIWKTKEAKAYGAVEIKPAGPHATVRTNGSDSGDDPWKKQIHIPIAPGPITVTAQPDGTALISNGKATWVLEQEYRYGAIKLSKKH